MLLLVVYQKEHPTPFLHAKISLFSYANVFLFRAGRRGGMIEGGGGVQLLRRGMESVFGFREMKPG